ncbi:hypothetical protein GCM10023351_07090 [Microbacterium gilvum]|uniref:Uncharacterized protein n=1 Tax=Microbacterium gilvum TaxID=1336204 RepID=A0ABP8ZUB9_9MICO
MSSQPSHGNASRVKVKSDLIWEKKPGRFSAGALRAAMRRFYRRRMALRGPWSVLPSPAPALRRVLSPLPGPRRARRMDACIVGA